MATATLYHVWTLLRVHCEEAARTFFLRSGRPVDFSPCRIIFAALKLWAPVPSSKALSFTSYPWQISQTETSRGVSRVCQCAKSLRMHCPTSFSHFFGQECFAYTCRFAGFLICRGKRQILLICRGKKTAKRQKTAKTTNIQGGPGETGIFLVWGVSRWGRVPPLVSTSIWIPESHRLKASPCFCPHIFTNVRLLYQNLDLYRLL